MLRFTTSLRGERFSRNGMSTDVSWRHRASQYADPIPFAHREARYVAGRILSLAELVGRFKELTCPLSTRCWQADRCGFAREYPKACDRLFRIEVGCQRSR